MLTEQYNIRRDASHQATSAIVARTKPDVERPSVIVMEELHVAGMMKNHNLARAIADVGMGEFGRQLEYKAAWSGSRFVKTDRWFHPASGAVVVTGSKKRYPCQSESTAVLVVAW